MIDFSTDELIGTFEKVEENDFKAGNLKSQVKMLNEDSNAVFKEFAKDKEVNVKFLKQGYKHWKEKKRGGKDDAEEDDLYTILALVDSALDEAEDEE